MCISVCVAGEGVLLIFTQFTWEDHLFGPSFPSRRPLVLDINDGDTVVPQCLTAVMLKTGPSVS